MAEPPQVTLSEVSLNFGGAPLFESLDLSIAPGDRLALVGRNGSGKSTLMKLLAGSVQSDSGTRFVRPGLRIGRMLQEPDLTGFDRIGAFVSDGLDESEHWRAEMAMEKVGVDPSGETATASGGSIRRAALARLVAQEPELLLLDEPTNHLDIAAIEWLEAWLRSSRAACVVISHDRAFLRNVTNGVLWLDRGVLRRSETGFAGFDDWQEKVFEEEDARTHKLERLIKAEGRWAVEGISARRKRNQGRVRRLAELRAERRDQISRQGVSRMQLESGARSGRLVVEAEGISKSFGGRTLLKDFSLRVQRGDRIAIVGPNGAGKTTLIRILLGEETPDAGRVRLGANLSLAVFDQNRAALKPEASLWETLTGDADLEVSGKGDQVMVRGRPRHVVGYLKDFLFPEVQARGPVSALSGGEKARLLLAKLMARESNVLVLDEPTNDLDVESLDLLQEVIDQYDGTVLLVSHDRDFVDRVATTTLVMRGGGLVEKYAGGWSDAQAQAKLASQADERDNPKPVARTRDARPVPARAPAGLTFTQLHRLEELPRIIDRLTAEIGRLEALLGDAELYSREPAKFAKAMAALSERNEKLLAAEEEWLALEGAREAAGGDG